ncbi:MAG: glutamine amidotransferase [Planctomycetota bacterium]|nr:glutamine amidotransferase [Planctomycetota bacterium]MDA1141889.1 glutamine amidotransferase [Planctomycetota bacterium]
MHLFAQISYRPPPWPGGLYWIIVIATLAGGVLLYLPARLGLQGKLRTALVGLRLAALALILFCLARPMIKMVISSEHDPNLVIAVDVSESMGIEDYDGPTSRLNRFLREFETSGLRDELAEKYRLRIFEIDTEAREARPLGSLNPTGDHTYLGRSLEELIQKGTDANTIATILVTDGADNSGKDFFSAAEQFTRRGVPLLVVGMGTEEVKDLEIVGITTRKIVRMNTTVVVRAKIRQSGFKHHLVPIKITRAGETVASKEVALKDEFTTVEFEFTPTEEGLLRHRLEIPPQPGEVILKNNERDFSVNSSRRKIRVLYMEGSQYKGQNKKFWEFQYLEQALLEDEDVEVTCLFRDDVAAAAEAGIGYVTHPDKGFPRERKDLFKYDVIISSDIDIGLFTDGQLENTVDFVGDYGGGFCMIGGWTAFGAGGYDESIIDQMLPVDMAGREDRYQENVSFKWMLTPEAFEHPIMRLVSDPIKNRSVWRAMPDFKGYNNVIRAKPAATVLAAHPTDRTKYGRKVMLAVQHYGKGRSMAFMPDTTAGWGEDFEELFGETGDNRYYKKFWKNAIRWLAAYRINVPNQLVTIQTDSTLYERGQNARIEVSVLNNRYEPSRDSEVDLEVKSPSGELIRRKLAPDLSQDGIYPWELPVNESGLYQLVSRARDAKGLIGEDRAVFAVQQSTAEFRDYALNRSLLTSFAALTHGKYYSVAEISKIPGDLTAASRNTVKTEISDIWDHPLIYLVLLALLTVEWIVRKKQGLL